MCHQTRLKKNHDAKKLKPNRTQVQLLAQERRRACRNLATVGLMAELQSPFEKRTYRYSNVLHRRCGRVVNLSEEVCC